MIYKDQCFIKFKNIKRLTFEKIDLILSFGGSVFTQFWPSDLSFKTNYIKTKYEK